MMTIINNIIQNNGENFFQEQNMNISYNEFHISRAVRDACKFNQSLYASSGNVIFANLKAVQDFQLKLNALFDERGEEGKKVSAGSLNAMGLIDEIFHFMCMLFRKNKAPLSFTNLLADLDDSFGKGEMDTLLIQFMNEFPPTAVYQKKLTNEDYQYITQAIGLAVGIAPEQLGLQRHFVKVNTL